ncbi:MAG: hypothetical protein RLZZ608_1387, partial [Actinomycetota bacterium]
PLNGVLRGVAASASQKAEGGAQVEGLEGRVLALRIRHRIHHPTSHALSVERRPDDMAHDAKRRGGRSR